MKHHYLYVGEPRFGFETGKTYEGDDLEEIQGLTVLSEGRYVQAVMVWLENDPEARVLEATLLRLVKSP